MTKQGKYLYGIIEKADSEGFDLAGVEGAKVYGISHRQLTAMVSDIEVEEVDPTRKNVLAHTMVQDKLLKEFELLPMSFGMIANSEEEVRGLLEANFDDFVSELRRLSGKIEAELKVFWDQKAMINELQGESEELTRLKKRINNASSPVEAQRLLVEAGRHVEKIAGKWKEKYARRVYSTLEKLSIDARQNDPVGVKNILNASFLIDGSKEDEFKQEVRRLDSEYQGKTNFKYVGPLPPYNFIKMDLQPVP
jgi:hypothetical protein